LETAPASDLPAKRLKILAVGEILWDVFSDTEHLGGATLNFAAHAARLNHDIRFVSAVGDDERGRRALIRAAEIGLDTRYISTTGAHSTGVVTVTVDAAGQPAFVIHRPAAYDYAELADASMRELTDPPPDWIYFGTLYQMNPRARSLTLRVLKASQAARKFYDVNLRRDSYTPELVLEFLRRATVVKLSDSEMERLGEIFALPTGDIESFCRESASRFQWEAVCVTQGSSGCSLLLGDEFVQSPGYKARVADTVGAGDAFAAALLHGLGNNWEPARITDFANRVGALVASRPGGTPIWNIAEALSLH
jgi:fructokinase